MFNWSTSSGLVATNTKSLSFSPCGLSGADGDCDIDTVMKEREGHTVAVACSAMFMCKPQLWGQLSYMNITVHVIIYMYI